MGIRKALYNQLIPIRQAFIVILPVVVSVNLLVLFGQLFLWLSPHIINSSDLDKIVNISKMLMQALPFLLLISLVDILAHRKGLDRITAVLVGLSSFLMFNAFCSASRTPLSISMIIGHADMIQMIVLAFVTVNLLAYFKQKICFPTFSEDAPLSRTMMTALNILLPTVLFLFVTLIAALVFRNTIVVAYDYCMHHFSIYWHINEIEALFIYTLIDVLTWFIGIHGSNFAYDVIHVITGNNNTVIGHWLDLSNTFVSIGGTGATLGLLLAIFFSSKVAYERSISKIALPFVLFNINEVLIYGIPIVLNTRLLLPFVLAPLVNVCLIVIAIKLSLFQVVNSNVSWMSPPLFGAYVLSGGNLLAVALQVACIVLSTLIYIPFIKKSNRSHSNVVRLKQILTGENSRLLPELVSYQSEQNYVDTQAITLEGFRTAENTLKILEGGRFIIYIQPKVNTRTAKIEGGEVLLRLLHRDGSISPPYFLNDLYRLGLSAEVDDRVVDMVFEFLNGIKQQTLPLPSIAINLDKPFLLDAKRVDQLIQRACGLSNIAIVIEITEHTYIKEIEALSSVVQRLKAANIRISVDDFGAGYSSLALLSLLDADEIKFDRSMVVQLESDKGRVIVEHLKAMCDGLNCKVIAEGVETAEQLNILEDIGIHHIQGYFTGHPMPTDAFMQLYNDQNHPESQSP